MSSRKCVLSAFSFVAGVASAVSAANNCCELGPPLGGYSSGPRLTKEKCTGAPYNGTFYANKHHRLGESGCNAKGGDIESVCSAELPLDACCELTGYAHEACHDCGDGLCATGEYPCNCPSDCPGPCAVCGDGLCHYPEDSLNCPADCPVAKFYFEALSEPPGATTSEAHGVSFRHNFPPESIGCYSLSVGRATTPAGTRAIAWERSCLNGGSWQTTELPLPVPLAAPDATTMAFSVACDDESQVCVAYGIWQNPASAWNALIWVKPAPGNPWLAQPLPMPPGHVAFSGKNGAPNVFDRFDGPTCIAVVGTTVDSGGFMKATRWKRPLGTPGVWNVTLLPDSGPGFQSQCTDQFEDNDRLMIVGSAGDDSGELNACVWKEMPGGAFSLTQLLRLPGPTCGPTASTASAIGRTADSKLGVVGFSYDFECARRAVLWRKVAGVWQAPIDLGALPGHANSEAVSLCDGNGMDDTIDLLWWAGGTSHNGPGTERATVWEVSGEIAEARIYARDANSLTPNLPPDAALSLATSCDMTTDGGGWTSIFVGSFRNDAGLQPHAYALTSIPQPRFQFQALPEPPGTIMSSAKIDCDGTFSFGSGPESVTFVGGCTPNANGTPAVVWEVRDGMAGDPVILPDPFCGPCLSDADIMANVCFSQVNPVCYFGGFSTDLAGYRQPVLWTRDPLTATYSAEVLPLPPDAVGTESGLVAFDISVNFEDIFCSAGTSIVDPFVFIQKATLWTLSESAGLWQVETLPDNGPDSPSKANAVALIDCVLPAGSSLAAIPLESTRMGKPVPAVTGVSAPASLNPDEKVRRLVGGSVKTIFGGDTVPCVWDDQCTGVWNLIELPLPPGMTFGPIVSLTSGTETVTALGYSRTPVVIPFRWERNAKGFWDPPTALSAIPGYPHAIPSKAATTCGDCVNVVGTSYDLYPFGGAIPHPRATLWNVPQDFPMSAEDLNHVTVDLPGGVALTEAAALSLADNSIPALRGGPGCLPFPGILPPRAAIVGTFQTASGGLRGTSLPHAYLLTPLDTRCTCRLYADVVPDCIVELADVLRMLAGYADPLSYPETDVAPCGGDGLTELADILALLNAYAGTYLCPHPCPP